MRLHPPYLHAVMFPTAVISAHLGLIRIESSMHSPGEKSTATLAAFQFNTSRSACLSGHLSVFFLLCFLFLLVESPGFHLRSDRSKNQSVLFKLCVSGTRATV